jgi:hypothetical protein
MPPDQPVILSGTFVGRVEFDGGGGGEAVWRVHGEAWPGGWRLVVRDLATGRGYARCHGEPPSHEPILCLAARSFADAAPVEAAAD